MPHYFFHVRSSDMVDADRDGIEFENLQAAETDARASLFEMLAEELAKGHPTSLKGIDITDHLGRVLAAISIDEAIKR